MSKCKHLYAVTVPIEILQASPRRKNWRVARDLGSHCNICPDTFYSLPTWVIFIAKEPVVLVLVLPWNQMFPKIEFFFRNDTYICAEYVTVI